MAEYPETVADDHRTHGEAQLVVVVRRDVLNVGRIFAFPFCAAVLEPNFDLYGKNELFKNLSSIKLITCLGRTKEHNELRGSWKGL